MVSIDMVTKNQPGNDINSFANDIESMSPFVGSYLVTLK